MGTNPLFGDYDSQRKLYQEVANDKTKETIPTPAG